MNFAILFIFIFARTFFFFKLFFLFDEFFLKLNNISNENLISGWLNSLILKLLLK